MKTTLVFVLLFVALCSAQVHRRFSASLSGVLLHADYEGGGIHNIYLYCDLGFGIIQQRHLEGVIRPGIKYSAPGGGVVIDADLRRHEKHTCQLWEIDVFKNAIDTDREDDHNDFLGYFTVSRADFYARTIKKELPGVITVYLTCSGC